MDTKMKIVSLIAAVSTTVAVVEGILLVRSAGREPPAIVAPAPAGGDPAKSGEAAMARAGGDDRLAAESPVAPVPGKDPQAPGKDPNLPAESQVGPTVADAAASTETPTVAAPLAAPGPADPELSPEEKLAQEKARDKAKMEEAMALMADTQISQLMRQFELTEAQQKEAAPVTEKLKGLMLGMMNGPRELGEALEQKAQELRQSGRLTKEQIQEMMKPEQAGMMGQIRESVLRGQTDMMNTLEELRPILDQRQAMRLDMMIDGMKQSQAKVEKMMDAMTEPDGADAKSPAP